MEQRSTTGPPRRHGLPWSASLRVSGGSQGPRIARVAIASVLKERLEDRPFADVQLVVSELVTNSVQHARVGPDRAITIDVLLLRDRVRLTVVDPGPPLTLRRSETEFGQPHGLGFRFLERLSNSCGVAKAGNGVTRVWAEILTAANNDRGA